MHSLTARYLTFDNRDTGRVVKEQPNAGNRERCPARYSASKRRAMIFKGDLRETDRRD